MKTKVVLIQLGSPKDPSISSVRKFLREFLADPRVVDINPLFWKLILYLFVLPFRPARSAKLYRRIWDGDGFPLIKNTEKFSKKVGEYLDESKYEVNHAFLLSPPRLGQVLDDWTDQVVSGDRSAAQRILVIPMFPQYSESTVASGLDVFVENLKGRALIPTFEFVTDFHKTHAFIDNSVRLINKKLEEWKMLGQESDALVISFHGIPKRRVLYKHDPYYQHCFETYCLIKERVQEIDQSKLHMTFQSRFGSEEWLTPYTDEYVTNLVKSGSKKIAVYCPSFVADCLETIDEIGHELSEEVKPLGGNIQFIPCLNDDDKWAKDFASYIVGKIERKPVEEIEHSVPKEILMSQPEQVMQSPPLTDNAKKTLKIVFLTLFMDLVGFSIIFPLFPALAKHYLTFDSDNYFLQLIFGTINSIMNTGGGETSMSAIVLFGGALGALYSFLQFIAAPFWGGLSDRIGRRPVLLISVACLALSYLLWFFSGSFTLLIIARIIGGIMGGNISTATAVVADVTQKENRSKGMATVGIAFALGFIIGPAMGGISSLLDLTKQFPELINYGVNPFSMPALIAFILSSINWVFLWRNFKESLPAEKRGKAPSVRSANIFALLKPLPYKGVNLTNFSHFLFLTAFSGMEFTLTFLAVERLGFNSLNNAYMFIFIGFIIAIVQGGVVRRKAHQVGEKKMVMMGLASVLPGLVIIGFAQSTGLLYFGLAFLAIGSAMAIPCLTSLVSLYTPAEEQGRSIGIFRSLGALSRVIGPLMASVVYWRMGSAWPYFLGASFLVLPLIMVSALPRPAKA